ncbi:MAG: hypothetical protein H0T60_13760 [Acidobacteria bacterium]|nr:hypothetical protein [Acidobacteriota bacterium]
MTKILNIRIEADRAAIEAAGYKWVTVCPRGENIGRVVSKHGTYAAANKRARNRDLAIHDVLDTSAGPR